MIDWRRVAIHRPESSASTPTTLAELTAPKRGKDAGTTKSPDTALQKKLRRSLTAGGPGLIAAVTHQRGRERVGGAERQPSSSLQDIGQEVALKSRRTEFELQPLAVVVVKVTTGETPTPPWTT
jgi:hypothetical protein